MRVLSLITSIEPVFWDYVNTDVVHYFFFAYYWKYKKDKTEILLVLKEGFIDGLMLVFDRRVVQLRGSREAAKALLGELEFDQIRIQSLKAHESLILEEYEPLDSYISMLMTLTKGQERAEIKHTVVELEVSDAEEVAMIMKESAEFQETTSQLIAEGMNDTYRHWIGIRILGRIVSFCSFIVTNWVGLIEVVATTKEYQNLGYATSTVSYAVEHIMRRRERAIIFVRTDNNSAIKVYKKVGFQPYETYYFMKGRRR